MNKLKRIVTTAALLTLAFLLASCSVEATSESQETVTKYDNYGREIKITQVPENVITMGPNCSELFVALGISDKIIGNTLDNHSRGSLPEYKKAYDKIPELTYGPATREAVLSSEADFIYGIDWEFGSENLDVEELTKSGIQVYENSAKTFAEEYQEIMDLGKIFGIEDTAKNFVQNQKERIEKVAATLPESKKRVLVYDSGNKGIFTASGTNFESLLIEQAGGENIFSDLKEKEWLTVSEEDVLKRDPEVIVVHDYDQPSIEEKLKAIYADPVLSQTTAVKNKKIVTVSLESVLPGPRMADTVEKFHEAFTS